MSNLNLVTDAWIPILEDGAIVRRTPLEILRGDAKTVAYAQPDLNAACVELLVAMAQTACPPETDKEWVRWMKAGAWPDDLEQRFLRLAPAFNLLDPERPFMQDPTLDATKAKPIELLDATRAPANAVTEGRAIFARADANYNMTLDEAALRLWIYETWSPVSSSVLKGSYRGHGPLSTLVRRPTIGQTVLANVLAAPDTDPLKWIGWGGVLPDKKKMPRLEHVDADDPRTTLWMTPRRVLLTTDGDTVAGFVNGSMRGDLPQTVPHPHSPGRVEKLKWIAGQGRVLVQGYPALLPLVSESAKPKAKEAKPAEVALRYQREWAGRMIDDHQGRLWAYGYHVDNNVDGWNETTAPLRLVDPDTRKRLDETVKASEAMLKKLWQACYEVVKDDQADRALAPHDKDLPFDAMRRRFFRATEDAFWDILTQDDKRAAQRQWATQAIAAVRDLVEEWISGYPENRLAGRVRARNVVRWLDRHKDIKPLLEES